MQEWPLWVTTLCRQTFMATWQNQWQNCCFGLHSPSVKWTTTELKNARSGTIWTKTSKVKGGIHFWSHNCWRYPVKLLNNNITHCNYQTEAFTLWSREDTQCCPWAETIAIWHVSPHINSICGKKWSWIATIKILGKLSPNSVSDRQTDSNQTQWPGVLDFQWTFAVTFHSKALSQTWSKIELHPVCYSLSPRRWGLNLEGA